MLTASHVVLALLWLPLVVACLYLLTLTLFSRTPGPQPQSSRRLRFDVIVPAHDESPVIARTVKSVLALDWPRDHFRIFVVADNCTDDTAVVARDAGAYVIERNDQDCRGKGYALRYAFRASRESGWADAVVVVDADSIVSPNLLEAFATRIEGGADAVQAHYGVLNPDASWRTRLMTVAKTCFHVVRSRGRESLGLSCGIRGNGWCVSHCLLAEVPYSAFSLVEDVEYGIALGLAGYRVHYADEAHVLGDMPAGEKAARSQRRRWEGGRAQMVRTQSWPLASAWWQYSEPVCIDLLIDLLVPPLTYLAAAVAGATVLTLVAALVAPELSIWLAPALIACAGLGLHIARGAQLSGLGTRAIGALLHAPRFLAWKLALVAQPQRPGEWIRTQRE
jgi:1,2-diacylglycerol 3-beta-glucosyltransferase